MSDKPPNPNITLKSNIWLAPGRPNDTPLGYAEDHIPGDLMVEILGTRDSRLIDTRLTPRQRRQYLYCRFFAYHGMNGLAYERISGIADRR